MFHYRWFSRDEEKIDDLGQDLTREALDRADRLADEEEEQEKRHGGVFTRGEHCCLTLCVLMLLYGLLTGIASFVLFSIGFLCYELRRLMPYLFEEQGTSIAQGMKIYGIVACFGGVLLLFL